MTLNSSTIQSGRRRRRRALAGVLGVGSLVAALALPLTAGASPNQGLSLDGLHSQLLNVSYNNGGNWAMYNAEEGLKLASTTGLTFQVPQGVAGYGGVHSVYLVTQWSGSLTTSNSISVAANWTPSNYVTRDATNDGAYGRLEIQDLTSSGGYNMNDYWWYNGTKFDLNSNSSGNFNAPLSDLGNWINICGHSAADTTDVFDCMTGKTLSMSPAQGFINAIANIREINISFGRNGSYASGIATTATSPVYFNLTQLGIN